MSDVFSPLADMSRRIPDGGRSSPRNSAITGVGIHHNAGVDAFGQASAPGREVSATYWITNAGALIPNISEHRRAWTSGDPGFPAGAQADHRNATFEVSNSPEGVRNGTWAISPEARRTLAMAIGDVYQRNGLGPVLRGPSRGVGIHSDWVPTICPGPYIVNNLSAIIAEAEAFRISASQPAPSAQGKDHKMRLVWDTDGTGWLVTEDGVYPLPSPQVYTYFFRIINSNQMLTPFAAPQVPGAANGMPDTFFAAELSVVNSILRMVSTAAKTGVKLDLEGQHKAISDALGKKFDQTTELATEELAAAVEIATERIIAELKK